MTDASSTDIRIWAHEHGYELGARGRIPAQTRAAYEAAHADEGVTDVPVPDAGETPPFLAAPEDGSSASGTDHTSSASEERSGGTGAGETPPKTGRRRFRDRIKPPPAPEGKSHEKRRSLERWADRAWRVAARFAGAPATPTGRVMNMQAPVAGMLIDDMVKGTVIDRIAQPVARFAESSGDVWGLVGPPVLVLAIERLGPAPVLVEGLRDALKEWVTIAGPAMARQKAREKKALEAAQAFAADGEPITSVDELVDALLFEIFGAMQAPENAPEGAAA